MGAVEDNRTRWLGVTALTGCIGHEVLDHGDTEKGELNDDYQRALSCFCVYVTVHVFLCVCSFF
jgi:hypothetical protein